MVDLFSLERDESVDLSRILRNNQQSNLDDFIEFEIYFDQLVGERIHKKENGDDASVAVLSPLGFSLPSAIQLQQPVTVKGVESTDLSEELYVFERLIQIGDHWTAICAQYAWTCCPLVVDIVAREPIGDAQLSQTKTTRGSAAQITKQFRTENDNFVSVESPHLAVPFNVLSEPNNQKGMKQNGIQKINLPPKEGSTPVHLIGRVRVGDNIEEEWLVVQLLLELSSQIPDLSISVHDADGEILLIESAMNLPSWLTPTTSKNRVWLRQGLLHIIPKSIPSSVSFECSLSNSSTAPLTVTHALRFLISDHSKSFAAKPAVQKAIRRRVKPFEKIFQSWGHAPVSAYQDQHRGENITGACSLSASASLCEKHRCRVIVPLPVALLLQRYPHLLGIALDHLPPPADIIPKYRKEIHQNNSMWESPHTRQENSSSGNLSSPACGKKASFAIADASNSLDRNDRTPMGSLNLIPVFDCSDDAIPTVCIQVFFNRCQIARLRSLRFHLPGGFAPSKWRLSTSHRGSHFEREEEKTAAQQSRLRGALERGAKISLGLLCAFTSASWGPSSCLAFFWDRGKTGEAIHDTYMERLKKFVFLLEESLSYQNLLRVSEKPASKIPLTFSRLQHFARLQDDASSTVVVTGKVPDISQVRFKDVLMKAYQIVLNDLRVNSTAKDCFCHCTTMRLEDTSGASVSAANRQLKAPVYDCGGVDCCLSSDDELWLDLSHDDVEKLISEKQKEDRFKEWVNQQLDGTGCLKKNQGDRRSVCKKTENTHSRQDQYPIDSTSGRTVVCANVIESAENGDGALDNELNDMFEKFNQLLNTRSGIEGIDRESGCRISEPNKIDEVTKMMLREALPSNEVQGDWKKHREFSEFLEDLNGNECDGEEEDVATSDDDSNEEEEGESIPFRDNWGNERLKELESQRKGGWNGRENPDEMIVDDEMRELMKLMDDELRAYSTKTRKTDPGLKDLLEKLGTEDGEILQDSDNACIFQDQKISVSKEKAFRDLNPMDMSESELATVLSSNMDQSILHETFLEPGPASIMLRSIQCFETDRNLIKRQKKTGALHCL